MLTRRVEKKTLHNISKEVEGKECDQIFQTICNSQYMVGKAIIHRWEENGKDSWYNGIIENLEEQEYRILYDNNNEPFFMTIAELLAEVIGMNDTHN